MSVENNDENGEIMPVLFWIVWFGLWLAALTEMTYDALRPTKRYKFAYAASLGGASAHTRADAPHHPEQHNREIEDWTRAA